MSRFARVVVPHIPHHIIQRGNRNQRVFFSDKDRRLYLGLLCNFSEAYAVEIWAYCLMDNHVHFVAVPENMEGLRRCFQEVHQSYTRYVNMREGWRGYLWQGRFSSFPMDERYLVAGLRYVENNPVRAGIVKRAQDYAWSSAKAHVCGTNDPVLTDCYLTGQIKDWAAYLTESDAKRERELERAMRTGRPAGANEFVEKLEKELGRSLKIQKVGRKRKAQPLEGSQESLPLPSSP